MELAEEDSAEEDAGLLLEAADGPELLPPPLLLPEPLSLPDDVGPPVELPPEDDEDEDEDEDDEDEDEDEDDEEVEEDEVEEDEEDVEELEPEPLPEHATATSTKPTRTGRFIGFSRMSKRTKVRSISRRAAGSRPAGQARHRWPGRARQVQCGMRAAVPPSTKYRCVASRRSSCAGPATEAMMVDVPPATGMRPSMPRLLQSHAPRLPQWRFTPSDAREEMPHSAVRSTPLEDGEPENDNEEDDELDDEGLDDEELGDELDEGSEDDEDEDEVPLEELALPLHAASGQVMAGAATSRWRFKVTS